ncbi:MAG TPA: DHA2 family efflux MFS transporter permease subunit [Hyphomicrobiaceae bacterium]|nr:DHA2 family efflux MFS transporter permease subunit [Hyphomicrobiaceae bacterium]
MTIATTPMSGAAGANRTMVTVCAMAATLMQALDSTIANVALPYMQGSLSTTADQITWVLTSYVVAAAIFTAPVGWLSTNFGRKRLFIVCVVGFTLASALCGGAQSLTQMVVFRLIQGMFGAALVPLSQATMLDLYPPAQRGSAMAIWGMGVMLGPILGPTLGGYLTDVYDWRWVFLINVPFGVLATAGLIVFMGETRISEGNRFDWIGFGVLSLGLAALQLMLDRGEQQDWFHSTEIIAELVLACLGIYLFMVHIFTSDNCFIPPRLFKDLNFSVGFLIMFAIGMILLASMALLPPYLQNLGGYSITTTGILMAPRGVGTMLAMMVAGRLTTRTDPRLLMLAGILMVSASMWSMTDWTPDIDAWSMAMTTLLQGFGLGFVFIPLQVVAYATLAPDLRGDATALFSLVRNVGSAVGISIATFLLSQSTQTMHARIAEGVTPFNYNLQTGGAYLIWNTATAPGRMALNAEVTRQASIIAYGNDFKFMLVITLATAFLLLLLRRPKTAAQAPSAEHAVMD